jgi:hypothetical protein
MDGWRAPKILHKIKLADLAMERGMFDAASGYLTQAYDLIPKTKFPKDVLISLVFLYGCMEGVARRAQEVHLADHCEQMNRYLQSRFDIEDYYVF